MATKPVQRPVAKRRKRVARKKAPVKAPAATPRPAGRLEVILRRKGFRFVAGVDEVGRGALAGPLVTAAVCLDVHNVPDGLFDSKVLTPEEREACSAEIMRLAVGVSYVVVDSCDIDDDGLGVSNLAALKRAVRALHPKPQYVISDHFPMDEDGSAWVGLPKADALSAAVAAASIVAKVSRDAFMATLDASHPGYNFTSNKGYGTDEHWSAIRALGPSPVHRRSFRGVASYQPTLSDI